MIKKNDDSEEINGVDSTPEKVPVKKSKSMLPKANSIAESVAMGSAILRTIDSAKTLESV